MIKKAYLDFDYTLYDGNATLDFLNYCANELEWLPAKTYVDELNVLRERFHEGNLSYNDLVGSIMKKAALLFKDKTINEIDNILEQFVKTQNKIYLYVPLLLAKLQSKSFELNIITASLYPVVKSIIDKFEITYDYLIASPISKAGDIYTGEIERVISSRIKLDEIENAKKLGTVYTLAIGDSEGDCPMVEAATVGIIVNNHKFNINLNSQKIHQINADDLIRFVDQLDISL